MLFPNIKFVGFFHDVFLSATFSLILFEKNNIIFSSTSVLRKLYNKPDMRIPVDTRSLIPVISVHSISNLQYRWQS